MCPDLEIPKQPGEAAHRSEPQTQGSERHTAASAYMVPAAREMELLPSKAAARNSSKTTAFLHFPLPRHPEIMKSTTLTQKKLSLKDQSSYRHFSEHQPSSLGPALSTQEEAEPRRQIFCL